MSTVISSSPLALRLDSVTNNNNNYSALRLQNFGEKKNKPSITTSTTSISSPSSSVSLNMFQEPDEEILNNSDIESDYDNYSNEVAEGLGIKLNYDDNLADDINIEVNGKEGKDNIENINDNDDNIDNDQNNNKLNNEKTKKKPSSSF